MNEKDFCFDREEACPCGSGRKYGECCCRFTEDGNWPETAEELMRARYTAYATQNYQFLIDTTLPSSRTPEMTLEKFEEQMDGIAWLELRVVNSGEKVTEEGVDYDIVEFYAYYVAGQSTMQLGERAYFTKGDDGRLYYANGTTLTPAPYHRTSPKVGRNDPCPCGSGKKYKKCCGRNEAK